MTVVTFEKLIVTGHTDPKKLLEVKPGEINLDTFQVPDNQLLVKAEAWGLNPTDWKHAVFKFGESGSLAGSDIAGTVVKVGNNVEGFKVGDDVSAFLHGCHDPSGNVGAFAGYTLVDDYATINYGKGGLQTAADNKGIIPAGPVKSFEGASSITLGLFTAGVIFNNAFELSTASPASYKGKKVMIWGASTNTGFLALQVAKKLYNLKVIAVASTKRHEYLKSLGADYTYDYKTPSVVETIRKDHPDILYGIDTISTKDTFQGVYDTLANDSKIDNLLFLTADDIKTDPAKKVKFNKTLLYEICAHDFKFGPTIHHSPEGVRIDFDDFLAHKISREFISNELIHNEISIIDDNHSFLKSVEEGLDLLRQDKVFGQKLVVRAADVSKQ